MLDHGADASRGRSRASNTGRVRAGLSGDPADFAPDMLVDDVRQMLVEPLLEDRAEHFADHFLERIDGGHRRRRGGGDAGQLLEPLAAASAPPRRATAGRGRSAARARSSTTSSSSSTSSSACRSSGARRRRRRRRGANSFSSAITRLIEARMSSIDGSRAAAMAGLSPIAAPESRPAGAAAAASSCGVTVRVATGSWRGSPAQSFQLPATLR